MKQTANFHLNKPEKSDYAKIQPLSDNMDIIDDALSSAISYEDFEEATSELARRIEERVPLDRAINGYPLSEDLYLSASDIGADPAGSASTVQDSLNTHTSDTDAHVTAAQKTAWDGKAPGSLSATVSGHTGNGDIHVSAADKTKWNGYQTVHTLGYSKSGTQHRLTGLTGLSGTLSCVFKATAAFAAGDTFTVDGVAYAVQLSNGEAAEANLFVSGATVPVAIDTAGKKVNFKAGGGLSNSKLALATATAADVALGKTFYAMDKLLKTGSAPISRFATGTIPKLLHYNPDTKNPESAAINLGWRPQYMVCYFYEGSLETTNEVYSIIFYHNGKYNGVLRWQFGSSLYYVNGRTDLDWITPTDTGFIAKNTRYPVNGNAPWPFSTTGTTTYFALG